MNVFQFFIICKRTKNANNATHYVKLGKKRRESSKRNYYIMSPGVIIKAIIIMSVSCTFPAKRLKNRGIYVCKDVGYEGCWSIAPKKSKTSVLAEGQHLLVNETVRYNVELTHVDRDCSCLRLHKLLHPFIIANGFPCDTQPRRGDACIHARQTCKLRIGLQSILKKSTCMIVVVDSISN